MLKSRNTRKFKFKTTNYSNFHELFFNKNRELPHSSIKVLFRTKDTIYLFFLVCEHPDKNTYLISQFSYRVFLILSRKKPAVDFVEPVLARHTENKFSSVLAYSRLWQKNNFNVNDNHNDNLILLNTKHLRLRVYGEWFIR